MPLPVWDSAASYGLKIAEETIAAGWNAITEI